MQKSDSSVTCNAGTAGSIRYNSGTFQACDGSNWANIATGTVGTTYTANQYGVALSSATNATLTILAPNASTSLPLVSGGTSANPSWVALTAAGGGTGVTSVTTSPTASSFAGWDASANMSADSFIDGFRSTATAAGTTTLVVGDVKYQEFTGSTTQTVKLPVVTTMVNGQEFIITNLSSGVVTLQSSGANTLQAMAANTSLRATVHDTTGGTGTASWTWVYLPWLATPGLTLNQITGASGAVTWTNGANAITATANTIGSADAIGLSTSHTTFTGSLFKGTASGNNSGSTGAIFSAVSTGASNVATGLDVASASTGAANGVNINMTGATGANLALNITTASTGASMAVSNTNANFSANMFTLTSPNNADGNADGQMAFGKSITANHSVGIGWIDDATTNNRYMGISINGVGYGIKMFANKAIQFSALASCVGIQSDSSGNLSCTSDERLKDIQGKFTPGLNALAGIKPITYKWNKAYWSIHGGQPSDKKVQNEVYTGFSAQNVKEVLPEGVKIGPDGYYNFQDRVVVAALVNAVNELSAKVKALEAKK